MAPAGVHSCLVVRGLASHVGRCALGLLGSIGLVVLVVSALIGTALLTRRPTTDTPAVIGASSSQSSADTDVPASNPPHVDGTCPLTPITSLAGGAAPEVDVSGLRWPWGFVPWVAGGSGESRLARR
jgi:hypothetical protein